jgi:hypothetical protein
MHVNHSQNSRSQPPVDPGTEPANILVGFLRRRWPLLIVCLALGACGGWLAARKLGQTSFTLASLWLYSPQQQTAPHYIAPDVNTIVSLIRSPGMLSGVAEEFKLPSGRILAATLRVDAPMGSQMLSMQLEGDNPQQTAAIMNCIAERLEKTLHDSRAKSLDRALNQLTAQVTQQQQLVASAGIALREFQQAEQIIDLEQELQHIRSEIDALEVSSRTGLTREGTRTDDTAQRRSLLRDLIQEERDAINARSQLALKRNDYDRAKALHDKRYISTAEFQRIAAEFQALSDQEQGVVARYREKLKQFDSHMANHIEASKPGLEGSPQLSNNDLGAENVRDRYDELLRERRARLAHLLSVYPRGKELADTLTKATAEKDRLEGQLAALRQIASSTDRMFSVLQPPRPTLDPVRSTSKKIMAIAGASVALAAILPLFLLDLFLTRQPGQARMADEFGLPVLTRRLIARGWNKDGDQLDHDEVRRLALRIQQSTPDSNRVVLLTSVNQQPIDVPFVANLAERMAQRGEHVAVIEVAQPQETQAAWQALASSPYSVEVEPAANHAAARTIADSIVTGRHGSTATVTETRPTVAAPQVARGLSDYLVNSTSRPSDTCRPTSIPGVDVILSSGSLPEEGLASRRMTALVEELRDRYSLVLIAGPHASQSVDVQMLSARADAIIVCALGGVSPTNDARRTIADLIDARAPLLGMVC